MVLRKAFLDILKRLSFCAILVVLIPRNTIFCTSILKPNGFRINHNNDRRNGSLSAGSAKQAKRSDVNI